MVSSSAMQNALLAPDPEGAQHIAEAIDALRELAIGPASARIDVDRLPGAPGREVALEDVGGEVVAARDRLDGRARIDRAGGPDGDVGQSHRTRPRKFVAGNRHLSCRELCKPPITIAMKSSLYSRPSSPAARGAATRQERSQENPMDDTVRKISADDINPRYQLGPGAAGARHHGVDFEERVDYRRLHRYRLSRVRQALEKSELGALLVFDVNNIRYITSTKIGEWERDKLCALGAAHPRPASPSCGISARPPCTTSSTRPGSCRRTARPGSSACAAPSIPAFGLMERHAEEIASLIQRGRRRQDGRSASTSSSRR